MNISDVFKKELEKIKLSDEEYKNLDHLSSLVIESINKKLKRKKIDAKVFVGGSLAKKTLIKKPKYDVDLFLRFNKKYSEDEINKYCRRIFFFFIVPGYRTKVKKVHGSRDYYHLHFKNHNIVFEIVPTVSIKNPEEARNITDLSYFHVSYVTKEINKNKKLRDEILLAKSFCYSQGCYGAESYINGFSGYAIELLIIYFKSFKKFIETLSKAQNKIVIDMSKHYKNSSELIKEMNPSKIKSPVILIDPTFKKRNASGALSYETFNKFKIASHGFLTHPGEHFFDYNKNKGDELKEIAKRLEVTYSVFEVKTGKQEGDIAGSKLLKFSKVLTRDISKYYTIIGHNFEYEYGKTARVYYVLQKKEEIIINGPNIHMKNAVENFKKKHPIWYIEDSKIKSAMPTDITLKDFLKTFKKTHKKVMKEMSIKKVKLV
ncbi:nucleotidyltransferase domain-containing protein [Candidatus Pacearchaeota archaeon]|nr:nucleotidyltransferase domain-containing protein [Candidatus Pacearchaeota archaeon]